MKKKNSLKSGNTTPNNVDEYLAGIPEPARTTLQRIRAVIRSAVSLDTTEAISYGMPVLKYKGSSLVWYAAFSGHCSLFPTGAVIQAFQDELKTFPTSKGTIRFPMDRPLPTALLKKIVKARVAQVQRRK